MNIKTVRAAEKIIRRKFPDLTGLEFDEEVQLLLNEWFREEQLEVDDTPCLENGVNNCDDWGTGEGQYHGRM